MGKHASPDQHRPRRCRNGVVRVVNMGTLVDELVVLPLPAGEIDELICNLAGRYAARMYAELTVS